MPTTDTTTKNDLIRLWDEIDSWDDREALVEFAEELAEVEDDPREKNYGFAKTTRQPENNAPSYVEAAGGDPDDTKQKWG